MSISPEVLDEFEKRQERKKKEEEEKNIKVVNLVRPPIVISYEELERREKEQALKASSGDTDPPQDPSIEDDELQDGHEDDIFNSGLRWNKVDISSFKHPTYQNEKPVFDMFAVIDDRLSNCNKKWLTPFHGTRGDKEEIFGKVVVYISTTLYEEKKVFLTNFYNRSNRLTEQRKKELEEEALKYAKKMTSYHLDDNLLKMYREENHRKHKENHKRYFSGNGPIPLINFITGKFV